MYDKKKKRSKSDDISDLLSILVIGVYGLQLICLSNVTTFQ